MAAALIVVSWWTGIDPFEASQSLLGVRNSLTPKVIALIVALL